MSKKFSELKNVILYLANRRGQKTFQFVEIPSLKISIQEYHQAFNCNIK